MSVVWSAIYRLSFAGFLITNVVFFVGMFIFKSFLDHTVGLVLTFVSLPLFLMLTVLANNKLEERRLKKYSNVDDQSTRQDTTRLQSLSFLPANNSNLERPQIPVQQRIPEPVPLLNPINEENDHPPSYEEVNQNRIQLQGIEVNPRGSCCALRHLVEQSVCSEKEEDASRATAQVIVEQTTRRNNASTTLDGHVAVQDPIEEPPPSYEDAVQNQIQFQGSPRGSCLNISLINETVDRNEPNAVYFINIPPEDSNTSSRVQSERNDLRVPIT